MATRADVERLAGANRDLRRIAVRDAQRLWRSLDLTDALGVREALEDLLPDLVAVYGEVAATAAADHFDGLREGAGVRGRFSAVMADPVPADAVRANARWSIGPLFSASPDPDAAFGRLAKEVDRMALQPGRDTISQSVKADPSKPKWARVPSGPETCAFCLVMASRGAVYVSDKTAGGMYGWHSACDCTATPIWDGQAYPDAYEPDALYEVYADARASSGSGDLKTILSKLRETQGLN